MMSFLLLSPLKIIALFLQPPRGPAELGNKATRKMSKKKISQHEVGRDCSEAVTRIIIR